MKFRNKVLAAALSLSMLASVTVYGANPYSDYSEAYKKTASVGSLNAVFNLSVDNGSDTITSTGNMKMNASNEVYYEMEINGTQITQYVQNGQIHTLVDGEEQIASTDNKDQGTERADVDGGEGQPNEKTDGTGFNSEKFLEEFSGILEAGKIKELGVLDPIDKRYIKNIESEKEGDEVVYTMTFPNEFLKVLLNVMVEQQMGGSGSEIKFSELKDFECVVKENSDGYVYYIEYKGYTTVGVSGDLTESGSEESFDLHFDLITELQNPGTAVDVVIPE